MAPQTQIGMHGKLSPEAKARRKIKNARNLSRKSGEELNNHTTHHPSCKSYGCTHKRHSVPRGSKRH